MVDDPYLQLSRVISKWFSAVPRPAGGISPQAAVASSARLGAEIAVAPFVSIGEHAKIGNGVVLYEGVTVGASCEIGDGTVLYPGVTVYHGCRIGNRCIIHARVVIGADGFGFATADGLHHKIPQIGIVRIEDDVEIGAGSTIDRAALGETVIGAGTKIDNLVQIGHNVKIGPGCLIVAFSGIAGSSELGDHCVLGGQSGVGGHVTLGSRVMVAAQAAVMKDFEGPVQLAGSPARPLREHLRSEAAVQRLPEYLKRLKKVEELVAKAAGTSEEKSK